MKMLDVLFATGYLDRRASHLPKGDMIPPLIRKKLKDDIFENSMMADSMIVK